MVFMIGAYARQPAPSPRLIATAWHPRGPNLLRARRAVTQGPMKLKPCPACGHETAAKAQKCPQCGKRLRMSLPRAVLSFVLLAGMV